MGEAVAIPSGGKGRRRTVLSLEPNHFPGGGQERWERRDGGRGGKGTYDPACRSHENGGGISCTQHQSGPKQKMPALTWRQQPSTGTANDSA